MLSLVLSPYLLKCVSKSPSERQAEKDGVKEERPSSGVGSLRDLFLELYITIRYISNRDPLIPADGYSASMNVYIRGYIYQSRTMDGTNKKEHKIEGGNVSIAILALQRESESGI